MSDLPQVGNPYYFETVCNAQEAAEELPKQQRELMTNEKVVNLIGEHIGGALEVGMPVNHIAFLMIDLKYDLVVGHLFDMRRSVDFKPRSMKNVIMDAYARFRIALQNSSKEMEWLQIDMLNGAVSALLSFEDFRKLVPTHSPFPALICVVDGSDVAIIGTDNNPDNCKTSMFEQYQG